MKSTGVWLNCVHRTCAETAAVSSGTSHAAIKERYQCTTSVNINNTHYKKDTVTHSESYCDMCVLSLHDSRESRYIKAININNNKIIVQELCESRGGRPGLSVLTSLLVSVDVKLY